MKPSRAALALLAIVLLAASCTKPEDGFLKSNTGNNLLGMKQTDTISIDMVTEYWPKLLTNDLGADVIGTFNDPIFGRTTSSVYTQVSLPYNQGAPTWGASSSMDSVVLTLKVANNITEYGSNAIIGNNNFKGQTWHIFKMADGFGYGTNGGTTYPQDTAFHVSGEIGSGLVSYNAHDSILRLSIPKSSINPVFRDSLFDTTGNAAVFTDPTEFDNLMHGIYILPDSAGYAGNGEMAAFDLQDTAHSKLTINYDGGKAWSMVVLSTSKRVNVYSHNYKGTEAWAHVGLPGSKTDKVYLQALGGLRCIVKLPYLEKIAKLYKDSIISINQAEFIFPRVDSAGDAYSQNYPLKIFLKPRRSDGKDSVYDFEDDVLDYYAQTYQTGAKAYKFLMTRYIQRLVYNYRNKPNLHTLGMNLYVDPDVPNGPYRTMLYTQHAGNKQNRPKLVLTYTKIVDRK